MAGRRMRYCHYSFTCAISRRWKRATDRVDGIYWDTTFAQADQEYVSNLEAQWRNPDLARVSGQIIFFQKPGFLTALTCTTGQVTSR